MTSNRRSMDGNTVGLLAAISIIGLSTAVVWMATNGFTFSGGKPDAGRIDWETLLAAALAVGAAFVTVRQVREQILQTRDIEEENRRRDRAGAKAVLPLALTAITDYSARCSLALLDAIDDSAAQLSEREFRFPAVPTETIPTLRDCVRFAESRGRENEISDLISEIQSSSARLRDFGARVNLRAPLNLIDFILDAVEIYARASSLFDYARREPEGDPQTLKSAFFVGSHGVAGRFPSVDDRIAKSEARFRKKYDAYRQA